MDNKSYKKEKIAIVVQRCHKSIAGGSEALALQYAELLSERFDVHILTTCALKSDTWENELPAGREQANGFEILRFRVTTGRTKLWHRLNTLLVQQYRQMAASPNRFHAAGRPPENLLFPWSLALQEEWIRTQGPHSNDLLDYIKDHHQEYRAFIFVTYLYSPAYFGSMLTEKKQNIFVPTLHDEPQAYLSAFRLLAERMQKLLWNTSAEAEFGQKLWGKLPGKIVSMGVRTELSENTNKDIFVLYSGRIDAGKGCKILLEYFCKYKRRHPSNLKLFLTGSLQLKLPSRPDIVYQGFVTEDEILSFMRHALIFIMPSPFESLSIVTLEAMAQGTPVLVNGESPVLREHIEKSHGGMIYKTYAEFEKCLEQISEDKNLRNEMGAAGRKYVLENFNRERVKETLIKEIQSLLE